jgi:hypothetical protein
VKSDCVVSVIYCSKETSMMSLLIEQNFRMKLKNCIDNVGENPNPRVSCI